VSSPPKIISTGNGAAARAGRAFRVAIVGAGTMRGKEVAEIIHDRNFPAIDVKLLDEDDSLGKLETAGDEVTFIQNVSAELQPRNIGRKSGTLAAR
jgi:hypothetical protein